jgi:hypothetical protein
MRKRRYEGLLSEEREAYLNMLDEMTYEEIIEYKKCHPELLTEQKGEIKQYNMTIEEMCKKYDLVDMTNFFISHGVKLNH